MGVPFDYFVAEACAAYSPMPGAAKVCFHYLGEELSPTDYTFPGVHGATAAVPRLVLPRPGHVGIQAKAARQRVPFTLGVGARNASGLGQSTDFGQVEGAPRGITRLGRIRGGLGAYGYGHPRNARKNVLLRRQTHRRSDQVVGVPTGRTINVCSSSEDST